MGFVKAWSDLLSSDTPKFGKTEIVKNPLIQTQIDSGIASNRATTKAAEDSIRAFNERFAAATPQIERFNADAIANVDRIYNGQLSADLAGLRGQSSAARRQATDRALRLIEGQDKAYAASLGLPGRSSYRDFTRARLTRDAEIDAALQEAAQARGDFGYLTNLGMSNLTTRQQLADALTNREALPATMAANLRGMPLNTLAQLLNMDQANKWYGLYKIRNNMERAADFDEENIRAIGQLQSIIKGFGPGGGGGIQSTPKETNPDRNPWTGINNNQNTAQYDQDGYSVVDPKTGQSYSGALWWPSGTGSGAGDNGASFDYGGEM